MSRVRIEFRDRAGIPFVIEADCVCAAARKVKTAFPDGEPPQPHKVLVRDETVTDGLLRRIFRSGELTTGGQDEKKRYD